MTEHNFTLPLNQMLIDNTTSRFLSGHFIFMGIIFLLPGIFGLITLNWIIFAPNLFISWFLFGTYSGVEINTEKNQFREYDKWFGLLKTGQWLSLENYPGVTLISMNKVHRMFSQSNRVNSYSEKEFRIYLVNASKKPAIAIKKCETYEQAQKSVDEFSIWLHKPVFSIKK